ncbi:hypothetical protein CRUP_018185, partial [Coryphaenoides rupestris]
MLEQGVDRIVAQVVDPKINHTFRPQVERVVREFLSPGSYSDEPPLPVPPPADVKPEGSALEQVPSAAPPMAMTTTVAALPATNDAMSILDTITTLNQGTSTWAGPSGEKGHGCPGSEEPMQPGEPGEQDVVMAEEGDRGHQDGQTPDEAEADKPAPEGRAAEVKTEDTEMEFTREEGGAEEVKRTIKEEEEEEEEEMETEGEKEKGGGPEQAGEENDKTGGRAGKPSGEKQDTEDLLKSPNQMRQKARERLKEEYSLEDSDLEGLSDITVSSVHTSDLSSFEEDSDEEQPPSESSEEGELPSDGTTPAPEICFERVNSAGDPYGNCGKDSKGSFAKCEARDARCGKIQCQGGATRPVIGTNAVSIETNIPLQEGGRILCRGTHVYLGDDMPDPGLVLSGTKCGEGMVCNNKMNCHCESHWAPPLCQGPGFGGSVDSGPMRVA